MAYLGSDLAVHALVFEQRQHPALRKATAGDVKSKTLSFAHSF